MDDTNNIELAPKPWDLRYGLLLIAAFAQMISMAITWPLWNVRTDIPHLPLIDIGLPQFSFGWIIIGTLLVIPFRPKQGVWLHFAVMLVACLFDQMRAHPQFLATWVLMFATLKQANQNYVRWFLVSLWIWAGLHKAISPEWLGQRGWAMTKAIGLAPYVWATTVCITVAATEMLTGLLAWWKPKWGAVACVLLHVGIAIYLSPLVRDWNYSVLPWNLATAIVGFWILWTCDANSKIIDRILFGLFMIVPAGFYIGWVDHGYAHVLYSGSMPQAMITRADGSVEKIRGWGELAVPFPKERRTFKQYFETVGEEGDRLHILDPRVGLDDLHFIKQATQVRQIERTEFFAINSQGVAGSETDSARHVFYLEKAGVSLLKRDKLVYAIEFKPENFSVELLSHLKFLPNIEAVNLSETSVSDEDLRLLVGLPKLTGVGVVNTSVSDRGIDILSESKTLSMVIADDSQASPQKVLEFIESRQPGPPSDDGLPR